METKPDYLREAYDAPRQMYKPFEATPNPAQPSEESKSKRKLIKLHPDSDDSEEIERRKQAAAAE